MNGANRYCTCRWDICHIEDIFCFYCPETKSNILFSGGAGTDILMWDLKSESCINTFETGQGATQVGCTRNLTGIVIEGCEFLLIAGCDQCNESGHIGKSGCGCWMDLLFETFAA
jgi:hypothetical protein